MKKPPDLYAILGVAENASPADIKKSYRTLAKKYHPDRTGGDKAAESRFKEISAAYDVLSDDQKKARYDAMRRGGFAGFPGGAPGGVEFDLGDIFGGGARGGRGAGLGDLFEQIFGAAAAGRGGGGFGGSPFGPGGRVVFEQDFGRRAAPPPVPPPVETHFKGPDGTEYLRRGDDLYLDVPLSFEEAVLGAQVEVSTPGGKVKLRIPPGTSSGKHLRLRGKGMSGRGDLYVVTQIVVPTSLDEKATELLHELSKRAPVKPRR